MKLRAVALLMLVACGGASGTHEIPLEDLPFSLARGTAPTETAAPRRTLTVYLVRAGHLVPRTRAVSADVPPGEAAMRALLDGPTAAERGAGVGTELPATVRLLTFDASDGTAVVDLSGEFQAPAQPERVGLRVAQVTWTLTQIPGIFEVVFSIDGEPVPVVTDDGTPVQRPVRRPDYAAFAPIP